MSKTVAVKTTSYELLLMDSTSFRSCLSFPATSAAQEGMSRTESCVRRADEEGIPRFLSHLCVYAKGVASSGTDDMGGPKASEISELRRTAKWHDPPEEIREEEDLLAGEETISEMDRLDF